jgi:hypothetical protein
MTKSRVRQIAEKYAGPHTSEKPMTRGQMLYICEAIKYMYPTNQKQRAFNDGVEEAIRKLGLREPHFV